MWFFHIPKLPDGFEFFPCLFKRVSPENNGSMKLKRHQESRTAKAFSAGALMALRGLPAPDQLHPHSAQVSGPHISSWGCQSLPQSGSRAGLHPQGGAWCLGLPCCPTPGQGLPGDTAAPEVRKPPACVKPWHSEATKQIICSVCWDGYSPVLLHKINEWHNSISCAIPVKANTEVRKHSDTIACQTVHLKSLPLQVFQMRERWRQRNMRRKAIWLQLWLIWTHPC